MIAYEFLAIQPAAWKQKHVGWYVPIGAPLMDERSDDVAMLLARTFAGGCASQVIPLPWIHKNASGHAPVVPACVAPTLRSHGRTCGRRGGAGRVEAGGSDTQGGWN